MTRNFRNRILPYGGVPIRLDPRGGVPRTARLTGTIQEQKPTTVIPITSNYAGRNPIASLITRSRGVDAPSLATRRGAPLLSTGRSIISPVVGDGTGIIPPSTLATQGVFGGVNGSMGTATSTALGPATLTGLGSSVGKMGVGITNTLGTFVPLAIKVILAVIVIKIVLWLILRRRK